MTPEVYQKIKEMLFILVSLHENYKLITATPGKAVYLIKSGTSRHKKR